MFSSPTDRARSSALYLFSIFAISFALGALSTRRQPSANAATTPASLAPRYTKPILGGASNSVITPAGNTITVNSLADVAADDGQCTLREAITAANTNTSSGLLPGECVAGSGSDSDTADLTGVAGVINLSSALPDITSDMAINGPGANQLTVMRSSVGGTPNFRVLTINSSATVLMFGLTISNGNAVGGGFPSNSGGGILNNAGNVTLNNLVITGNSANSAAGGVDNTSGIMTINNSTISNNGATSGAGVNNNGGGSLTINRSTISNNNSTDQAGGLFNSGTALVTNTTISSNSAVRGAGIDNAGPLTLSNSTISLNTATNNGGGVTNLGIGVLRFTNTLIAGNSAPTGPDCFGASFSSQDYNLIGNTAGATISGTTNHNITNVNALLGPLANNGGPTMTHALLPGSPAIDAGDNCVLTNSCSTALPSAITTDQRGAGFNRSEDGNGDGTAAVDIGAYEVQSILVTNTNDSGAGSLRQAITDANASQATKAINFQSGLTGNITLLSALPNLSTSMSINGPGASQMTVQRSTASGIPYFRIFAINSSVTASISGLTIANGIDVFSGGGVLNNGTLTLTNCSLFGNSAGNSIGGGIYNDGPSLTLNNCNIGGTAAGQANTASSKGGGIFHNSGTLLITGGSIAGNSNNGVAIAGGAATMNGVVITNNTFAGGNGGGIAALGGTINIVGGLAANNYGDNGGGGIGIPPGSTAIVTVVNTTISGNSTANIGGGISNASGTAVLTNVTITNNRSGNSTGGGIFGSSASGVITTLRNTIVAGNFGGPSPSTTANNISGAVSASSSFNLIGTGGSGGLVNGVNNNQIGVANSLLGPLANNGGSTQTMALLPGSPALDAGSNTLANNAGLTTDQRGAGFNRIVNGAVDIGAFESRGFTISATSGTPQSATITTAFASPLVATVSSAFGEPVVGGIVTFTAPASGPSAKFTGNVTTFNATINASGQASASPTANGLAGGPYTVAASSNGVASAASFSLTNTKAATNTALSSSLNPSSLAQSVTFTATVTSSAGTPTGTVQFKDNGTNIGTAQTLNASAQASISTSSLTVGTHTITAEYSGDANFLTSTGTLSGGQVVGSIFQFSDENYYVGEGDVRVNITVTRSGDTSGAASVNYATIDAAGLTNCNVFNGVASPRCDYINTLGTMSFAAGEGGSKSFSVAIVDDSYAEGNESFTVSLTGASGATLGAQSTATVTIIDNDSTTGPNPIDNTNFFVRQQYIDFLGREPDPPGFAGWTSAINNCSVEHPGHPEECDRIHVSQLFFESQEFQQRGYFVYRFYPVSFGRKPDYAEFVPDLARVSGFLDATQLEAAKVAFITDFMARPAFSSVYNFPSTPTGNQQYVDALLNTAGVTLSSRQSMIDGLNAGTLMRTQVLRQIVESAEVATKYNHQAYAVMEYFGYLRRQPDAFYLDWIKVLDQTNDPRGMVTGFVNSIEYRQRFGPP